MKSSNSQHISNKHQLRGLAPEEIDQVSGSGDTAETLVGAGMGFSAGIASGAIAGTVFGGVIGTVIGASVGALVSIGYGLATSGSGTRTRVVDETIAR